MYIPLMVYIIPVSEIFGIVYLKKYFYLKLLTICKIVLYLHHINKLLL